jgi:mRNA interferase RelE/StbE
MIWRIEFTHRAERDLKHLPKSDGQRIKDELTSLAEEPFPRLYVKKLKGNQSSPLYSYRVGPYRIILAIENGVMTITVIEVGNRSKVYRKY